jgi:hypothetical protein
MVQQDLLNAGMIAHPGGLAVMPPLPEADCAFSPTLSPTAPTSVVIIRPIQMPLSATTTARLVTPTPTPARRAPETHVGELGVGPD